MKFSLRITAMFLSILLILPLSACFSGRESVFDDSETIDISELTNKADPEYDRVKHFPNGLELTLSEDESYYILSSGVKCTDEIVTVPESYNGKPIMEIADEAFLGNTSLRGITIPESVIRIGTNVFWDCDNLEYNVYDNAKYLGSEQNPYAFLISSVNKDIESVKINESTRIIAASAFFMNEKITSLVLPDNIVTVGLQAFHSCIGLAEVDFGHGVKYIEGRAFGNTSVTKVRIPDSTLSIGYDAFVPSHGITLLELGNSIERIEAGAFLGLKTDVLVLPDSLTELGDNAFGGSEIKKLIIGDGLKVLTGFSNCDSLTEIAFGDSVEYIVRGAFRSCESLRKVKLPKSLKAIHIMAFEDCDNLEYNEYNEGLYLGSADSKYECLMRLPRWGYDGNLKLHPDVRLIAQVTFYEEFYQLQKTNNITMDGEGKYLKVVDNCVIDPATKTLIFGANNSVIPNDGSVTAIGEYAFYQRDLLETLTLPEGLTAIGDYAFYACDKLRKVEFNAELKTIGDYAFAYSDEYRSPELPEGLNRIGEGAFTGCDKIGEIYIPGSVEEIGREAFAHCYAVYKITIGEGVTELSDYLFHDCNKMTDLTLPSTLKVINTAAFRQCHVLKKIELPEGLLYIEGYAFELCPNLTRIDLPQSLVGIGQKAFSMCSLIDEFTFNSGLLEVGNDVIRGISPDAKISFDGTVEMWENIDNHDNIIRGMDDMRVGCIDGEAVLTPDDYPKETWW